MSELSPSRDRTPRFSIVSAVYNVAAYLDDFIASIEAQDFPLEDVEVVLVDDGSTDASADRLKTWQATRPDLVTVLTKPNGGQASARNLGLEHARGQWVTFTDPDDMLEPDALREIDTFLRKHPTTMLAALRRELFFEATGERKRHPLDRHFAGRNRLRNLDDNPGFFFGSAPCGFFRRDEIERLGLRFREDIRPSFEDGYFCDEYLLQVSAPLVGFVRTAGYVYRKRADRSSTLGQAANDVARYTVLLERGYLNILRESLRLRGRVPRWLQTYILYELSWQFGEEERATSPVVATVADRTATTLAEIAKLIEPDVVASFTLRRYRPAWRDVLLHGFDPEPWHTPFAVVDRVDTTQGLQRLTYRFTGDLPQERVVVDGDVVVPAYTKIRAQPYFARVTVRHRILWVPYGTVSLELDGHPVELVTAEPEPPRTTLDGWRARNALAPRSIASERRKLRASLRRTLGQAVLSRVAASAPVRRLFRDAWVLIDRVHDADDSAEHLFRHLRAHDRDVNAWFVVERGTTDFRRLRRDGYRRRVVPYGGVLWTLLMLNADQLISSHADKPVVRPAALEWFGEPLWRTVFLQHGVTKDDLSQWLNPKQLTMFVVSTVAEYESVVADGTAYDYTARETKLTGLPRFDKIRAAGQAVPPAQRDLILVAPTWRQWLLDAKSPDERRWQADAARFAASDYATNWRAVLTSDALRSTGVRIGLMLHPNLQMLAGALHLPPDVELLDFDGDVSRTFARARVLVTDYSSTAFNAAYTDRPVVYFQFDRDRVLGGGHVGRRGYFDYERDGFGPVTLTADAAVEAVVDAVAAGPGPREEYARRIAEAFPLRDGRCCERAVAAIRETTRRHEPVVVTSASGDAAAPGGRPAPPADATTP